MAHKEYFNKPYSLRKFASQFLMAGWAAALSKAAILPIENTQIKFSLMEYDLKRGALKNPYSSLLYCARQIIADQGYGGLWRSSNQIIPIFALSQALNFAFRSYFRNYLVSQNDQASQYIGYFIAGGLAGATSSIFVYPTFRNSRVFMAVQLRRLQAARAKEPRISMFYRRVNQRYKGFSLYCVTNSVYRSLYFGIYDTATNYSLATGAGNLPLLLQALLSWAVAATAGLISHPLQNINRKISLLYSSRVNSTYVGDYWNTVLREESLRTLFAGVKTVPIRSLSAGGSLFLYERIHRFYFGRKLIEHQLYT